MKAIVNILLLLLVPIIGYTKTEKDYVKDNCTGIIEYILPDKTRVDCLTDYIAWEYDYAHKWYEAVGQALYYAMWTGRIGGVALIADYKDIRFIQRAKLTIEHYNLPIRLKVVNK